MKTYTESRLVPVYELLLGVAYDIGVRSEFMTPVIEDFVKELEDFQDTGTVYDIEGPSQTLADRHNNTMRKLSHITRASADMIQELIKQDMIDSDEEPLLYLLCRQYIELASYVESSILTLALEQVN